jgi:N-acetyltransferase
VIAVTPVTLEGHGVRLEPLGVEHADALGVAVTDGKLWELWFTTVPEPSETAKYIADALDGQRAGHMLPWVVRELTTGAIVGSTRYHDIVPEIDRVEIGYTWYGASWQRSQVNTACKLLLMTHAFERLGARRVELKTDERNERSRGAMLAFGATFEGIHRKHMVTRDGGVRNTAWYSVVDDEWPTIRAGLRSRLAGR